MSDADSMPTLEIADVQRCGSSHDRVIVQVRGHSGDAFRLAMTTAAAGRLIAALNGSTVASRAEGGSRSAEAVASRRSLRP